jgi:hypothetical protein
MIKIMRHNLIIFSISNCNQLNTILHDDARGNVVLLGWGIDSNHLMGMKLVEKCYL